MRLYSHRSYRSVPLLVLLCVSPLVSRLIPPGQAQSETKEKPTLKNFGSSIKRLKWDPSKQAAVETEDSRKERRADAENVVRITTDLVVCDVMVLDKQGRAVNGLTKDDFAVSEDDKVQQVAHFSLGSNATAGRSIVLIMDYSGSLAPYINLSVDAAKSFIEKLNPNDRVAIVTNEVTLLVNFTSDKSRLKKALESLKITALTHKGNSYQFSALLATARELFDDEDIRPIIIFQTDGDEVDFLQPPDPWVLLYRLTRGRIVQFGLGDVYTAVEKSRATVYTVIPGFRLIGLPEAEQLKRAEMDAERVAVGNGMGGDYLSRQPYHPSKKVIADNRDFRLRGQMAAAEVAKLSGGWTSFLEEPEQAEAIYSSILLDMNNRYIVGYYPTNKTHDGKRRKLLVEVRNHPEYSVWGRKSYIAPQPDPQN